MKFEDVIRVVCDGSLTKIRFVDPTELTDTYAGSKTEAHLTVGGKQSPCVYFVTNNRMRQAEVTTSVQLKCLICDDESSRRKKQKPTKNIKVATGKIDI